MIKRIQIERKRENEHRKGCLIIERKPVAEWELDNRERERERERESEKRDKEKRHYDEEDTD